MATTLKVLLAIILLGYAGFTAVLYVAQRSMLYLPETVRTAAAAAGFGEAQEVTLDTPDGEKVIVWHAAPRDEKPVVLYFQGNGGALRMRAGRFHALAGDGFGVVALSYRGYAGSSGHPSEAGLLLDAATAYDFAVARYGAARIAVWGESLGTGVAAALAADKPVGRVILESPFTAAVDLAASIYYFLPVRLLMKDPFRSDERVPRIKAPVLVMHGDRDPVVPFHHGERIYALINAPKRFVRLAGAQHNDHDRFGAVKIVEQFLDEKFE
jgi:fermentation-respiration switch protein FrsA (DUF1100 family)